VEATPWEEVLDGDEGGSDSEITDPYHSTDSPEYQLMLQVRDQAIASVSEGNSFQEETITEAPRDVRDNDPTRTK